MGETHERQKHKQIHILKMSTYESEDWQPDETIELLNILKSLQNISGSPHKYNWQHVANELCEQNRNRNIHEVRERFKKLQNDYFTARYRNRSCQYYKQLKELFGNEQCEETEEETQDQEEEDEEPAAIEEHLEVEPKYADSLQIEFDDDQGHPSQSATGRSPLRCKWAEGELNVFLGIITKLKLQAALLGKRNAKVFKLLSKEMAKHNYSKRPDQLRVKYHQLRRQYAKAKNGGQSFEHFEEMHALLNGSLEQAEGSCEEIENSESSAEEEVAMGSDSETEAAVVAAMPSNVRCKWAEGEVDVFLDTINTLGLQSALLRKRNAKIFKLLSKEMSRRSFDKPPEKLRIKFQQLRRQYNKAKNGGESFEHFDAMHKLLNPKDEAQDEAQQSSGTESDFLYSDDDDGDKRQRNADTYYWTDHEVDAFLTIIKQHNLFRALDGTKKRNFKTLVHISNMLAKQSFKRTPHQLRNKLRLLLRRYGEAQKNGLRNVRMLPRHFQLLDDLQQKKRPIKTAAGSSRGTSTFEKSEVSSKHLMGSDSDASSSASSCELLRDAADSEDADEDAFEMPTEPTPIEVMTSINEGQQQLLAMLKSSQETYLRQQREMQAQFLKDVTSIMRQEREETFRMLKELLQPK